MAELATPVLATLVSVESGAAAAQCHPQAKASLLTVCWGLLSMAMQSQSNVAVACQPHEER